MAGDDEHDGERLNAAIGLNILLAWCPSGFKWLYTCPWFRVDVFVMTDVVECKLVARAGDPMANRVAFDAMTTGDADIRRFDDWFRFIDRLLAVVGRISGVLLLRDMHNVFSIFRWLTIGVHVSSASC